MKVIHIGFKYGVNNTGGAAIASTRLHKALLEAGVESHYVCVWQCEDGENVHALPTGWRRRLYFVLTKLMRCIWRFTAYRKSIPINIVPMWGLERLIRKINPDVVHVQWINADVVSFEQLGNLRTVVNPSCKIIFNLHDFNILLPYGGHPNDGRYSEGFGRANSTRMERWLFGRKKAMIDKINPVFIGPSKYVAETCLKSIIGRGHEVSAISNIIDPTFDFHAEMYAPHGKFSILFGCYGGRGSGVKGWKDFVAALNLLPHEVARAVEVRVFGENGSDDVVNGIRVKVMGIVTSPAELLALYHQSDILAFPSVQETQGMTKCEALCCGMPVIAFDRTACAEGIEHKKTGWVADDGNARQFADGIAWWFDLWRAGKLREMRPVISNEAHSRFGAIESVGQIKAVYGFDE